MGPVSQHDVNNFAQKVTGIVEAQKLTGGSKIEVQFRVRFAKIIHHWGGQTTSWGWVDMNNGDVRRGSWKAPDMRVPPHTNIRAKDLMERIAWTGPCYHKIGRKP